MPSQDPSLIAGLDPAALFGLSAGEEGAGGDWQPPDLEEAARLFPQWKVLGLLGRGGMGAVYHIHQPDLDREVAVKLLPIEASRDERQVERFRREARTLAKLKHPGIVALHEAGITPAGHFFFVMEYVDGFPLSKLIADGKVDVPRAIEIVRQVCDALAYAHGQGVVHRDIKPSNILIDAHGQAKVADFGLAHWERAESSEALSLSRTGMFMGTPAYTAPEQARDAAHVDHRADIYSLGVLLYEMLTGELPRGVFQPPSRKSGSDSRLDEVVQRALQERPEDRYQAASELKNDVSSVQAPPQKKSHARWLVAAVVLPAIIGATVVFMRPMDEPEPIAERTPEPDIGSKPLPATDPEPSGIPPQPPPEETTAAVAPAPIEREITPPVPPPAPAKAPETPAPAPAPVVATKAKVWSIQPLSPALSPPAGVMKLAWKDCVLTRNGGAVLTEDGFKVVTWSDSKPGQAREQLMKVKVTALARNEGGILLLDEGGILWSLRLDGGTSPSEVPVSASKVTSSDTPAFACIATDGVSYFWPSGAGSDRLTLPFKGAREIAVGTANRIYALDGDDMLLRFTSPNDVKELGKHASIRKLLPWSEGLLALDENGILTVLDGPSPDMPTLAPLNDVMTGDGFFVASDANGKLTIWGPMLPDSPERMRMPEGTTRFTASPLGLIAAW